MPAARAVPGWVRLSWLQVMSGLPALASAAAFKAVQAAPEVGSDAISAGLIQTPGELAGVWPESETAKENRIDSSANLIRNITPPLPFTSRRTRSIRGS